MRKILAIGFIIAGVIVSCKKEEITPIKPIVAISKDCNCDRVVYVNEWVDEKGNGWGHYSTVNDCSGYQMNKNWYNSKPIKGQCKK